MKVKVSLYLACLCALLLPALGSTDAPVRAMSAPSSAGTATLSVDSPGRLPARSAIGATINLVETRSQPASQCGQLIPLWEPSRLALNAISQGLDSLQEITVLTYNTHLFGGSQVCGFSPEVCYQDEDRAYEIVRKIRESGADIVALEEVWEQYPYDASFFGYTLWTHWQEHFIEELQGTYPYGYYANGCTRQPLLIGSGLVLLSKWPLEEPSFTKFPVYVPASEKPFETDFYATKGVIAVTAQIGNPPKPIRIGISHALTGGYQDRSKWDDAYVGTAITPFQLNDQPHMFSLKSDSHSAFLTRIEDYSYHDVASDTHKYGAGYKDLIQAPLPSSHVAVESFELNGHPWLFRLTEDPSQVFLTRINDNPSTGWTDYKKVPWDGPYKGTTITSFELNGQPYVFGLGSESDHARISRINVDPATGNLDLDNPITDYGPYSWSRDYVAVESFELDGQPWLFGLKSGDANEAMFTRINEDPVTGAIDDTVPFTDFGPYPWDSSYKGTTITSFNLNGRPHIFGLKTTWDQAWISRIRYNPQTDEIEFDDFEFAWNRNYVAIEAFDMNGQPFLWALKDCCSDIANLCAEMRPGELFITRIYEEEGVVKVEDVNQLEDIRIIRDATVRDEYPAIMMGDFNVHKSKYGFMDQLFHKAGAEDAYIAVHGTGDGGETIDSKNNLLDQKFGSDPNCPGTENCFDRIDYVYMKPLGRETRLVPTDAYVIRDWDYYRPNPAGVRYDLSDHYPVVAKFELQDLSPALELTHNTLFELEWKDEGSAGVYDGAFYKPIVPTGYHALGHYGQGNYFPPNIGAAIAVRALEPDALAQPLDYIKVWDDSGSGASMPGSFWRPVPAAGYVCLGLVAQNDRSTKPGLDEIRCVREDLVMPGQVEGKIWTSEGTGASAEFGAWSIVPGEGLSYYAGTFTGDASITPPLDPVFVLDARFVREYVPPPTLELTYSAQFEWEWWDQGSGGDHNGAYYKPVVPAGFFALGSYGQGNYASPYGGVFAAKALEPGALAPPADYVMVWGDYGSGASADGSFWRPVPQPGYKCLGLVAQYGYNKPSTDEIRCVREDLTVPGTVGPFIWNDAGTGADTDFGSWSVVPANERGLYVGAFTGHTSHAQPTDPVYVLDDRAVKRSVPPEALELTYTGQFDLKWWDQGSGGDFDGAFYEPVVPDGYYALGHIGQGNYRYPSRGVYAARALEEGALAPPIDYVMVWGDWGSGAPMDGSMWKPIPPFGYVCLGLVAQSGYEKPGTDEVRCVREDLAAPGSVGWEIWIDVGTGADTDFGSWSVVPDDDTGLLNGGFTGHNSWSPPIDPVFVLDTRSVKWPVPTEALELAYTGQFTLEWKDEGSGGTYDGAYYKPIVPDGYHALGHYGQGGNYHGAIGGMFAARALEAGSLATPVDYVKVWDDSGSQAPMDGSFWRPIPQPGYICLGLVAQNDHATKPGLDEIRCVRWDLTAPGKVANWIWIDVGTGADTDFGSWPITAADARGIGVGAFTGHTSHSTPRDPVYVLDTRALRSSAPTKALTLERTEGFELVWKDEGSGGDYDGAFYRPVVPEGYYSLGHYGQGDYGPTYGLVSVAKPLTPDALAPPIDYIMVWGDWGSGAPMDGSMWKPVPPFGYVCLGLVAQNGYEKPGTDEVRCVREDLATRGHPALSIWFDRGTGADSDFGAWSIIPFDPMGLSIGTFTGHNQYHAPTHPVFVLDTRAIKYLAYLPIVLR